MKTEKKSDALKCSLVVTCVVIKKEFNAEEHEVLILRRSENEAEGPGLWTVPGGKVGTADLGDPVRTEKISHRLWFIAPIFEVAVKREVEEETGLRIDFAVPMYDRAKIFTRKDGTLTLVLVYWTFCRGGGRVALNSESTSHTWVKRTELERYVFIGNVKEDIEAALSRVSIDIH